MRTGTPACRSRYPAVNPAMPPPTISTGCSTGRVGVRQGTHAPSAAAAVSEAEAVTN
jgi:hypothetical protein